MLMSRPGGGVFAGVTAGAGALPGVSGPGRGGLLATAASAGGGAVCAGSALAQTSHTTPRRVRRSDSSFWSPGSRGNSSVIFLMEARTVEWSRPPNFSPNPAPNGP